MGVPKFYRWISERYPLVNQPCGLVGAPRVDCFYLDMNGIVHNCTHGPGAASGDGAEGESTSTALTEVEMMARIMKYLDTLIAVVRPGKLIYMAIDGCAPRAKMNQQRARRFRTAMEAAAAASQSEGSQKGDAGHRFDSNCITPGTPFMQTLTRYLKAHINARTEEGAWGEEVEVILNGHEVPGEGEHKIMEYIRAARSFDTFQPNQRHCMYGLDADLIMLALTTHEPHFMLLREVVSFSAGNAGKPARHTLDNPSEETFVLLQVGLLRDYLLEEFVQGFQKAQAEENSDESRKELIVEEERIIDDFVFLCMLVGNDFLPPLPTLDIHEGALDDIFRLYKTFVPRERDGGGTGAWLVNEAGVLNLKRFELFVAPLADAEASVLRNRARDAEKFEAKKSRRLGNDGGEGSNSALRELGMLPASSRKPIPEGNGWHTIPSASADATLANEESGGEEEEPLKAPEPPATASAPTMMTAAMRRLLLSEDANGYDAWKERHYRDKLHRPNPEGRREVVRDYIEGLQWVLYYYKCGVCSWAWYYRHHYAPLTSDLCDLAILPRLGGRTPLVLPDGSETFSFDLGKPFLPYEQLMAVLPAASKQLLPEPYRHLMTNPDSPIIDYYPENIEVDFEGKRAAWEGVALLPFIDEDRLLRAMKEHVRTEVLAPDEKTRNTHGPIISITREKAPAGKVIIHTVEYAAHKGKDGEQLCFASRLVKGTVTGAGNPVGFPTLKTLHHTGSLLKAGVDVFQCGMISRKDSYIVKLRDLRAAGRAISAAEVASVVMGTRCFVNWPYLREASVIEVCDEKCRIKRGEGEELEQLSYPKERTHVTGSLAPWQELAREVKENARKFRGIDVGEVDVLLGVKVCTGTTRSLLGYIEKEWSADVIYVPLQATLRRDPSLASANAKAEIESESAKVSDPYAKGARSLFLGQMYFGCTAEIVCMSPSSDSRMNVSVEVPPAALRASQLALGRLVKPVASSQRYTPLGAACKKVGLSPRGFGCLTASLVVDVSENKVGTAAALAAEEAEARGELPPEDEPDDGPRSTVDIGLNFKSSFRGEVRCVLDYAMPLDTAAVAISASAPASREKGKSASSFAFSDEAIDLVAEYLNRFPFVKVFAEMDRTSRVIDCEDGMSLTGAMSAPGMSLSRDEAAKHVKAAAAYLKSHPCMRRAMVRPTNSICAASDSISRLETASASMPSSAGAGWNVIDLENVPRPLLLPPMQPGKRADAYLGKQKFELGDRIASCIRQDGVLPPFGSLGTVVGVHGIEKFQLSQKSKDLALEVMFDAPFDGGTTLSGRIKSRKGALLRGDCILNLSRKIQSGGSPKHDDQNVDLVLLEASRGVRSIGSRAYASALKDELPSAVRVEVQPPPPPPQPDINWLHSTGVGQDRAAIGHLGRAAAANAGSGAVSQFSQSDAGSGATLLKVLKSPQNVQPAQPQSSSNNAGAALLDMLRGSSATHSSQEVSQQGMVPDTTASSGAALLGILKRAPVPESTQAPDASHGIPRTSHPHAHAPQPGIASPPKSGTWHTTPVPTPELPAPEPALTYEVASAAAAEEVERTAEQALSQNEDGAPGKGDESPVNPELAFWASLKAVYQKASS